MGDALLISISILLFTLGIIILVVWLPVYLRTKIQQMVHDNDNFHKVYVQKVRSLHNKENHTQSTLKTWPIWPRPVLYSKVDGKIQYVSAKMGYIFEEIQKRENEFQKIPKEWGVTANSKKFPLQEFRAIKDILGKNIQLLEKLEYFDSEIESCAHIILEAQKEVLQQENRVDNEFLYWRGKTNEYPNGIEPGNKANTKEHLRTERALQGLNLSVAEGQLCKSQVTNVDKIHYARLYVCNTIARAFWKHLELDYKILLVSEKYLLDESGNILDQVEPVIQTALSNVQIATWTTLSIIQREIQHNQTLIASADADFRKFEFNVQSLESRLEQLRRMAPDQLIDTAAERERELNKLWGERPEWGRILRGAIEPSRRLAEAKAFWQAHIEPKITGTSLIKQSALQDLVDKVTEFEQNIEQIQNDVNKIVDEIECQKKDRSQVQQIISFPTRLTEALSFLVNLSGDSAENIVDLTAFYHAQFKTYQQKMDNLPGPNFSLLRKDVMQLEKNCTELEFQHNKLLEERQRVANNLISAIGETYRTIRSYIEGTVWKIRGDWGYIHRNFDEISSEYLQAQNSYRRLGVFNQNAKVRNQDFQRIIFNFKARYVSLSNRMQEQFEQITIRETRRSNIATELQILLWENLLEDYKAALIECQKDYRNVTRGLGELRNFEWIDIAEQACEQTIENLGGIDKRVQEAYQEAHKTSEDIQSDFLDVLDTIPENFRKVNEDALRQAILECKRPTEAFTIIDGLRRGTINIHNIKDAVINIAGNDINSQKRNGDTL